ncbi:MULTISPECIES: hypothetical protein [Streptomyces]|uniref:Uncharacterized protein n=1 Tax=Streptomyces tsukubensis (strain DSM 42081 / NBRC 108919 / NRRL 18488 / 9993) TaxID=1114943 RepID=I2N7U5_STRT9|nr:MULTISPECIES: hypothetical protein [Streptomyces]AZK97068.1 hypothetical protein B7R87_26750 [Streptomyces tsukubensis]EIF93092.1 hypothetical protein [Streptomyces tsukubensis NRRL18488]MYS66489.1 hypothetical protein [Streptomyces sp. SID5473]QKM66961.1 hypothetical protein STSU_007030 [Streptomyces tsukubensis NRRL18488]TAI41562.1 hypothetical protein EWI31_27420 [Streptomyces tsukubensis]
MLDNLLHELHTHGIRPHVTGHRPGTPPWTQAEFTLGPVAVRLFDHHEPSRTTVEMRHLPVRHIPALLNAVGATPDPELLDFPSLPEDFEGEAARWLADQMGNTLGMVRKWPVPGAENDADPALYTDHLSTCWSGPAWALLELSGPSLHAPCTLRMGQLTDTTVHAVITTLTRTAPPHDAEDVHRSCPATAGTHGRGQIHPRPQMTCRRATRPPSP